MQLRLPRYSRAAAIMRAFVLIASASLALPSIMSAQSGDPNKFPTAPALGTYSDTLYKICGRMKVDLNPSKIPAIGCFAVRAGKSLDGQVLGRKVSIRVPANGDELFQVDGVAIRRTSSSTTNDPWVKPSASGFAFCRKEGPPDCPVMIETMDRKSGSFATFDVSREFKPRSFVTNQENWDAETKH